MSPRPRRLLAAVVASVAAVALLACGETSKTPAPVAVPEAPAALSIDADRDGLVFRFLGPDGAMGTATRLEDVPASARGQVVVYDDANPTPAGWDHVANLSNGYPVTSTPKRGFSFAVTTPTTGGTPRPAVKRSGAAEVVMFSTQGCGYCRKARKYFERKKIPFTELDVETNPKASERLAELGRRAGVPSSQLRGVPIIFVNGKAIVGWDQKRLETLLRG